MTSRERLDERGLIHATAVDALMAAKRLPVEQRSSAEHAARVVLAAAGPLIAAQAGRMEAGGYSAHWHSCWQVHADCAVLHAADVDRQLRVAERLLARATNAAVEADRKVAAGAGKLAAVADFLDELAADRGVLLPRRLHLQMSSIRDRLAGEPARLDPSPSSTGRGPTSFDP